MSALTRIANGTHKHFTCKAGDTVIITASVIPGNERTVSSVVNLLLRMGAILYSEQDTDVHVSGHGSQEELKLMLSIVKPNSLCRFTANSECCRGMPVWPRT
jgi:ribonuclease J